MTKTAQMNFIEQVKERLKANGETIFDGKTVSECDQASMDFNAHAPTDIAKLLKLVELYEAALDRLTSSVCHNCGVAHGFVAQVTLTKGEKIKEQE